MDVGAFILNMFLACLAFALLGIFSFIGLYVYWYWRHR